MSKKTQNKDFGCQLFYFSNFLIYIIAYDDPNIWWNGKPGSGRTKKFIIKLVIIYFCFYLLVIWTPTIGTHMYSRTEIWCKTPNRIMHWEQQNGACFLLLLHNGQHKTKFVFEFVDSELIFWPVHKFQHNFYFVLAFVEGRYFKIPSNFIFFPTLLI